MKNKLFIYAFALVQLVVIGSANAQTGEKIIITGSRFTYPLVNKWIEEYKKTNPDVPFHIIPRGTPNVDSANVIINAHELTPEEIRPGYTVINFGRYAIFPVANEKNPLVKTYLKEGIDKQELSKLFFKKYDPLATPEKESKKEKSKYKPSLYTREQKACAPTTFARNYGFVQQDILGKPIGGDDHHLIAAIKKDTSGITYNNLGFIYDIKTRKLQNGLQIIPLDINSNNKLDEKENFYASLDDVISKLESNSYPEITVGYVNISFPAQANENNKNITAFLNWVLNEGQKYNHEYGFLSVQEEVLAKQKQIVSSK